MVDMVLASRAAMEAWIGGLVGGEVVVVGVRRIPFGRGEGGLWEREGEEEEEEEEEDWGEGMDGR